MNSKLIFFFSLLLCNGSFAQLNVEQLRKEYSKVSTDSVLCSKLYNDLVNQKTENVIVNCYKGAAMATLANFTKSREEKFKLFKNGKQIIEHSIKTDSSNIELRFLRFTIQSNCPKILGYSRELNSDKTYILSNFSNTTNLTLKKMIREYCLQSNQFTEKEKLNLKSTKQ